MRAHAHYNIAYALPNSTLSLDTTPQPSQAANERAPVVAHNHGDTVALLHPKTDQAPRQRLHLHVQLSKAPRQMALDAQILHARATMLPRFFAPADQRGAVGMQTQDGVGEVAVERVRRKRRL